jgi:hypothetical protein
MRGLNKLMNHVRVKILPIRELLPRFHRSTYIKTFDLSPSFLQVLLAKYSRKRTDFDFEKRVFHFTRVLYGYKNSLLAFIRALKKVARDEKNVITYIDDIFLHSPGFEDHLAMLESVNHKFTSKGFTMNASKWRFCRPQIR